jgi:hypothetical protein
MTNTNYDFETATVRLQASHRGGGIEIDLQHFGFNGLMTAYQNYLGGGLLGKICNDCTIENWRDNDVLLEIADNLSQYFHTLTNPSHSEWESATYDEISNRPTSGY